MVIAEQNIGLPLEGGEFVLDASIDPLELAAQALAKLKAAGLPGYLEPRQALVAEGDSGSNVVEITSVNRPHRDHGLELSGDELEKRQFEETFLKERPKIRALAARIVGSDQAEDIVSETFFRAWNNRYKFSDQGVGMGPWLCRIAHNLCIDAKRKDGHFTNEDPDLVMGYIADTRNDYEEFEGRVAAEELLAATTPEQREAIYAVYVEGSSFADYAQRKGKTYGGTKSLVHRAKTNILKNMNSSTKVDIADILSPSERAQLTPRQQELFAQFLPKVEAVARKMAKGPDEPIEDLVSDGYVGLLKAVQRYDPNKVPDEATNGAAYVNQTIAGSIFRGLRDWHGRDSSQGGKISRLKPSVLGGSSVSIDAPLSPDDEGTLTLGDMIAVSDHETIDYEMLRDRVFSEASVYSDRDKEILVRRIILDQTQAQIAAEVGISQMHVSRLLERMSDDLGSRISY